MLGKEWVTEKVELETVLMAKMSAEVIWQYAEIK